MSPWPRHGDAAFKESLQRPHSQLLRFAQGRDVIEEEDLYAAMENKAMESFSEMTNSPKPGQDAGVPNPIPAMLRKAIAVYEAGKVLTAYITPEFEEIARVGGWVGGANWRRGVRAEEEDRMDRRTWGCPAPYQQCCAAAVHEGPQGADSVMP